MTRVIDTLPPPDPQYPDSDGLPMAETTLQWRWIVLIKEGIEILFRRNPNVFVAGDLFWYPVEGDPNIRTAPDVLVALGRPKGDRRSYKTWEENGIPPQVVFEILAPSNRPAEMEWKRLFYERYGVEEYYVYDPDSGLLEGWLRNNETLEPIPQMEGFVSPRLGIRFEPGEGRDNLKILEPSGARFLTPAEHYLLAEESRLQARRAEEERQLAEKERELARERRLYAELADQAQLRANEYRLRADRYAAKLRELGIEPE